MKIAIIGYGYIGQGYHKVFPDAFLYDPFKMLGSKEEANRSDLAVVCVPTPMKEDGSCDISAVEEVVSWLETPLILIKSTIPPGTTDYLKGKYGKNICFSPEYMGESTYYTPPWKYPDPKDPTSHTFQIIGGAKEDADEVVGIMITYLGPDKVYYAIDAIEAEIVKYMENSFGALKVSFCQEFYDICKTFGASYNKVREGFLLDPRVERMHTAVFPKKRKWGGKCWPKDVNAIVKASEKAGYVPELLKQVIKNNEKYGQS